MALGRVAYSNLEAAEIGKSLGAGTEAKEVEVGVRDQTLEPL